MAKLENSTIVVLADRRMSAMFGEYTSIYDMLLAIQDNAIVSIQYGRRQVKTLPDSEGIAEA